MLIDAKKSALLVVDVQARLLPAISGWQRLLTDVVWLLQVARRLEVPVLACQQYPKGLGAIHSAVAAELDPACVADKIHFSAVAEDALGLTKPDAPAQVIVCGIESHVCVLQTVLDLRAHGKSVFVVAEAVGSRRESDKALALARMHDAGAVIVSREMVAFEWLRCADTEIFREISRDFLR